MRVDLDPNRWNLLQVVRIRRNTALQPTGLTPELTAASLTLYPNPTATGQVTLELPAHTPAAALTALSRQRADCQSDALARPEHH